MDSSKKYFYYQQITSDSCTLAQAQSIIQSYPQILTFAEKRLWPILHVVCMSKSSNPDVIVYLMYLKVEELILHNHNNHRHGYDDLRVISPLHMLIKNNRTEVLQRLKHDHQQHQLNHPILLIKDIINNDKFHFIHFAVSRYRLEWVKFLLEINPYAIRVEDKNGLIPMLVLVKKLHRKNCIMEYNETSKFFWDLFQLLLRVGIKYKVGDTIDDITKETRGGFGGLFLPVPYCNNTCIIEEIFKSEQVSWSKISTVVQNDIHARQDLIYQLATGNIPKEHCGNVVKYFSDCMVVRDAKGRLPIHIAAESGLGWDEGMKDIAQASFTSIDCIDMVSGLMPFALAAVGNGKDLQCIFELLRLSPTCCLLQSCVDL